jgi:hypothetical protein
VVGGWWLVVGGWFHYTQKSPFVKWVLPHNLFYYIFLNIFCQHILANNGKIKLRITCKLYDVFAVAIKETVGFQQPQKCGRRKMHKGRSPTAFFCSPIPVGAKHIQACYVQ